MASTQATGAKPYIVLLTLDKADFFKDMYGEFIRLLETRADVKQITAPDEARTAFNDQPKPAVIFCADESLTVSTRISLVQDALSYVRTGGVLIFMGLFSSFSRPPNIGSLFSRLELPWASGDYHRTTFQLNPEMSHFDTKALAQSYSQKALQLAHVSYDDAIYLSSDSSRIESRVFGPRRVGDQTQTPAALGNVGEGFIGYIGDVNNEEETTPVMLGMCGL